MEELIAAINDFDNFYEMSDSYVTQETGHMEKTRIRNRLKKVIKTKKQLYALYGELNTNGQYAFKRYFKSVFNEYSFKK